MDNVNIHLEIEGFTKEEIERCEEILYALIKCGGLSGVKNGSTIIHFDRDAVFQGIELDYWPFRKKTI